MKLIHLVGTPVSQPDIVISFVYLSLDTIEINLLTIFIIQCVKLEAVGRPDPSTLKIVQNLIGICPLKVILQWKTV